MTIVKFTLYSTKTKEMFVQNHKKKSYKRCINVCHLIIFFTYRIKTKNKNCSTIVYKVLKTLSNNYFVFCQKLNYLPFIPFLSPSHKFFLFSLSVYLIHSVSQSFINAITSYYLSLTRCLSIFTILKKVNFV